jgi:serpin B
MRSFGLPSLPLAALSLACVACEAPSPANSATSAAPTAVAEQAGPPVGSSPAAPVAAVSNDEIKALAKSSNAFGLDVYARARAEKGNLAISPFSIHAALAMTWAGARGETAAQMKKVLHLESERALDVAGSLIKDYGAPDQKVTVRIADRLFGDKAYAFEQPYLAHVRQAFGVPLERVDFQHAAPAARGQINDWVAKETEGRIKDLIPPAGITPETRLVLTNAIYFLGEWATPFKKEQTSPAPFFTSATDKKDVPTMHATEEFHFAATDGVKLADLPYEGGSLGLTIVVPDAVDGLDALEAKLTPEVLDRWLGAAADTRVNLSLPRLEIAPAAALSLGDTLATMGMPLAFDRTAADFTGIARPARQEDRLFISKVFHKAFVKVDEKGTEAAAATGVVMATPKIARVPKPAVELKADHPFLYLIRDLRSGLVLFMGRVADPATK